MEVKIKYLGAEKFSAESVNHKIIIDQPKEKGGTDEGMNPLEVFLAALGSCSAVYAKRYCQNANIDTHNMEVKVTSLLAADKPMRFQDIKVEISLGQDIGDRKKALLNFVENCPVRNTLKSNPEVKFLV